MKCAACGKETPNVRVCSSLYGGISNAYCSECLVNENESYDDMVSYISCAGHWPNDINSYYQDLTRKILKYKGISEKQFQEDVENEIKRANEEELEFFRKYKEKEQSGLLEGDYF